jgi:hypothetical protein
MDRIRKVIDRLRAWAESKTEDRQRGMGADGVVGGAYECVGEVYVFDGDAWVRGGNDKWDSVKLAVL